MLIKYKSREEIDNEAVVINLKRLLNQTYKLLPNREEGNDWKKPLETIIEEFVGMNRLSLEHEVIIFSLICKLEGLYSLDHKEDFFLYRRTIFDCIGIINTLIQLWTP